MIRFTLLSVLGVPGIDWVNTVTGIGSIILPSIECQGGGTAGTNNFINDIIITDGLINIAGYHETRNGFYSHRINNEVRKSDELIKMWDGLSSL